MKENISYTMENSDSDLDSDREEREKDKKRKQILRLPYTYPDMFKKLVQSTCVARAKIFTRSYLIIREKEKNEEKNEEERRKGQQKRQNFLTI